METLPDTSDHEKLSSGLSCEFDVSSTIFVDHAPELLNEPGLICLFENVEDPGVIDTWICTGKIGQENTRFTRSARDVCQGGRFHLEDVILHLSGRDTSPSRADTPNGVLMQAKADRRGDHLSVTVTQGQPTRPLSLTLEELGMRTILLAAKCVVTEPPSNSDLQALNRKREPNPPAHL